MTDMLTVISPTGATKKGYDVGMTDEEILHCYRTMLLVRSFDEICLKLQRSGRIGFSIPNRGIEACQVGAASALKKTDWIFPSYRDFGMALYHGIPAVEMMHNMFGNAEDAAKGRQMPVHFSFVDPIHFYSISSPIGTHLPHAVGAAYASQLRGEDTVHLVSFGDGGTSSSGFHSGMNFAAVWKSPVVFLCQNNGYAISCPSDEQTASDGYAVKAVAYGMPHQTVDGNDLFAVRDAVSAAVERARKGEGPSMIEAVTFRMGGHSTSDDPTKYVPKDVVEYWEKRDPVERFRLFLEKRGLWSQALEDTMRKETLAEIDQAAKAAAATAKPGLETIFSDVYAEVPAHIRQQGEFLFDLSKRRGEADAGDGEFPL